MNTSKVEICEVFPCNFRCELISEPKDQAFTICTEYNDVDNLDHLYKWIAQSFDNSGGQVIKCPIVLKNEASAWVLEGCWAQELQFDDECLKIKFRYDQIKGAI